MASVNSLLGNKETFHVEADQSVIDVVKLMVAHNIGAVVVMRNGDLTGLFTERDLMKRVVNESKDPRTTTVAEVMTRDLVIVSPERSLEDCLELMRERGFRHLPVCPPENRGAPVSPLRRASR